MTLAGPVVGIDVPDIKLRWLLPFVWLLFESAKTAPGAASRRRAAPGSWKPSAR